MATEYEFLGRDGTQQLVATVKALVKQGRTILADRTTGEAYTLYVDNGKLHMEEATNQFTPTVTDLIKQDSNTFIDRTTGKTYAMYVDNGKLHMEEDTE